MALGMSFPTGASLLFVYCWCKETELQARIKPTALCSAFDKENSIEFLLNFVHYLYIKSNPNSFFYPAEEAAYARGFPVLFLNRSSPTTV